MRLLPARDAREALKSAGAAVARILDGADYTADDVARECDADRALCLVPEVGAGVVVVRLQYNEQHGDMEMDVWLAASAEPHGAIERYMPEIERVARELRAARLTFSTFRRGWLRRAGSWTLRSATFERELTVG